MKPDYLDLINHSIKNKKEIKKFFDKIKKLKPSDLDEVTNDLDEKAFEKIDCLECANCCKTTGPLLLQKDVERLAKSNKMKPSEFTIKYLQIDEDQDLIFKNMPCPFLQNDNCCSVYNDRPNACREYPHTQQRKIISKLSITYQNTFICPAVVIVVQGLMTKFNK